MRSDLDPEVCTECGHPVDLHDVRGWSAGSSCLDSCEACAAAREGAAPMLEAADLPPITDPAGVDVDGPHDCTATLSDPLGPECRVCGRRATDDQPDARPAWAREPERCDTCDGPGPLATRTEGGSTPTYQLCPACAARWDAATAGEPDPFTISPVGTIRGDHAISWPDCAPCVTCGRCQLHPEPDGNGGQRPWHAPDCAEAAVLADELEAAYAAAVTRARHVHGSRWSFALYAARLAHGWSVARARVTPDELRTEAARTGLAPDPDALPIRLRAPDERPNDRTAELLDVAAVIWRQVIGAPRLNGTTRLELDAESDGWAEAGAVGAMRAHPERAWAIVTAAGGPDAA